ncbi:MAG: Arsenical resistance operon repressor, partial [uncultured Frankineae bacterium]
CRSCWPRRTPARAPATSLRRSACPSRPSAITSSSSGTPVWSRGPARAPTSSTDRARSRSAPSAGSSTPAAP